VPAARKLLVVNLYYPPDFASTGHYAADICARAASRGVNVEVVTGEPSYSPSAPRAPLDEIIDGVRVRRIPLGGARGREHMNTRLQAYLRFLFGAWRMASAIVAAERPESLLTFHNPPLIGVVGAALARRYRLRFIYVVYDIHPDVLLATGWLRLPRPIPWLWRRLNRWIASQAAAVVVIGERMKRTLVDKHGIPAAKIEVIPLWGRPELDPAPASAEVRQSLGVGKEELLLLYSGNMGIMHPLERILDLATALRDAPLRFLFVGDGAKRQSLEATVAARGLERVSFLPFQDERRFVDILAASDACFVLLEEGLEGLAVPSRAFTILSAGRALITLMAPDADVARLVSESHCGWNATDTDGLRRIVEELVRSPGEAAERGRRGRELYERRFKRDHVVEEYLRVLLG
jgi:glycosyltransferase involved in cell wall biosynthesis